METNNLIRIEHFCTHHNVEISFISSLHEMGLIDIVVLDENPYLSHEQLRDIEKMVRFHYDLDINLEGIEAISILLKQIEELQKELNTTKNKLSLFEIQ
jgi:hypothetical protein